MSINQFQQLNNQSTDKSQKPLDIDKTSESTETEPSKRGLNRRKFFTLSIILAVITILIIGGGVYLWQKTLDKTESLDKLVTIEGKFYIEPKTRSWGMVNGIMISGYDCAEDQDWCKSPNCKLSQKGCPYVNKTVSITGYLSPERCIGGDQCMNTRVLYAKSIKILDKQTTEIVIKTDKTEYQSGKNIKITIANNSTEAICYNPQKKCDISFWSLIRFQNNRWGQTIPHASCLLKGYEYNVPALKQLNIGEELEDNWNQKIYNTQDNLILVHPGKYRFEFEYWPYSPGCPRPAGELPVALSNEFEIKKQLNQAENYCEKDEDCVLINYQKNDCCFTCLSEAVNKAEEQRRLEWQQQRRCDILDMSCPEYECDPGPFQAICLNQECIKVKDENASCDSNNDCQYIDCSKYDTSAKEGYAPYCIDDKCKCMCYGCK